jgi:hypothetical protein
MILAMMDSPGNGSGGSRTGVGWWPVFTNRQHGARFLVRVQREFLQVPRALTLLRKLRNYIKDCATVVA